jgi:hypothetical protein
MHLRKRIHNKPTLIAACLGAGIALASGAATAVQATKWQYATDANFVPAGTQFGAGGGAQINTADVLAWGAAGGDYHNNFGVAGAANNQSALTIGSGTTGALRDNGTPVGGTYISGVLTPNGSKTIDTTFGGNPSGAGIGLGMTFTHWNNPISGSFATLTHGRVQDELSLKAIQPNGPYPGALQPLPPILFDFEFVETNNNPAGNCAGNQPKPCPDLFGIVGKPNLNVAFNYLDPVNNVNHQYLASIFVVDANGNPTPFTSLTSGECQALGLGNTCQGFRTVEGAQTTVQFAFAITTERFGIPEPGTLPLFGLALAWLGFAARRKSS